MYKIRTKVAAAEMFNLKGHCLSGSHLTSRTRYHVRPSCLAAVSDGYPRFGYATNLSGVGKLVQIFPPATSDSGRSDWRLAPEHHATSGDIYGRNLGKGVRAVRGSLGEFFSEHLSPP